MFRTAWLVPLVLMLADAARNPSPTQPSAPPPDAPAAAPTARLAVSYDALFTGEATMGMTPITFDGSLSQGERLSYVIEFGDGARAEVATATHVIDQKGSFTARLTVTDRFGRVDITEQVVKVGSFTDHTGLQGYVGWTNYLEHNPAMGGRSEQRVLDFLTHDGRRFTGRYRHPDCCGRYSLFHGTVDGAGGIEFALDDGTIVFTGRAIHNTPSPLMRLGLNGGSADGLTLDFNFSSYY
jgi:hypothetical protein